MSEAKPVRLAFIGSGSWALRYHFPALGHIQSTQIHPLRLRGIFSLDYAIANQVAARYEFDRIYTSMSAYLFGPLWADRGEIVIESATRNEALHQQRPQFERIAGSIQEPEVVTFGIVGEYIELLNIVTDAAVSRSHFQNAVNTMRVAEAIETGTDIG